jgi:hypothetical protein
LELTDRPELEGVRGGFETLVPHSSTTGRRSSTARRLKPLDVQLLVEEGEDGVDASLLAVLGEGEVLAALELDLDEGVADLVGERLEALADGWVLLEAQAEDLAPGGGALPDGCEVAGAEVEVTRRLAPTGNGAGGWARTGATEVVVELARQAAQPAGDRCGHAGGQRCGRLRR